MTRFDSDYVFASAVDELDAGLTGLDGGVVSVRESGTNGGWPAYVQEVAFIHEQAGPLVQASLLVLVGSDSVRDLVHVVGTAIGNRIDEDYSQVRAIVSSAQVSV